MRGVAVLASVLITVVAAAPAAQPNVSLVSGPSILTGGSGPIAIASGDLDGDDNIDLAVANYDSDDVSVLWGNGDGTFTPAVSTLSVGASGGEAPVAIAIKDVDGDGKLDIITANEFGGSVSVLLNQGGRTFAPVKESPTGTYPEAIAVGYFNGDDKLDVATPDFGDDTVTVLLGNGDGIFSILSFCATAPTQTCQSSADCPSDGACNPQPIPVGSEPDALVAVNLNPGQDRILDLVVVNSSGGTDGYGSLTVLKGLGNGVFTCVAGSDPTCSAPEITSPTFDNPIAIAVGQGPTDLNGDQNPDLVVVNDLGDSLSVLLGNGDLTFQEKAALNLSEFSMPAGAVVADFNGDGIPDIACSASLQDKVSVFVGQGNGNFAAPVDFALPVYSDPWGLAADDFNGDGTPDLAAADFTDSGLVSVLLNASGLTLAAAVAATDTTITLTDAGPLPASGTIVIDQEQIIYAGKQGNNLIDVTRGANGTAPTSHVAGAAVTFVPPSSCVGDCAATGSVDVEDILRMVNIALGNGQISDCLAGDGNGDGQITVDEILSAVNNALNGCGA